MSTPNGLSNSEVIDRIKQGQTNNYTVPGGRTYWHIFRENMLTAINIILATVALTLILVGRFSDGLIYFSVVFLNILVGLAQEIYAKFKLDQMSDLTSPKNQVVREGQIILIDNKSIVLGDLILVTAGEIIPVDGTVVKGQIESDESLLTGESNPIVKKIGDEVLSGSTVASGQIYFRATAVGENSMAAKISSKAKIYTRYFTPLQKEINLVLRILFTIVSVLAAIVGFGLYTTGQPFDDSVAIIAVILGIVPNSLMAMVNLAYAVGAVRILRRGALVQQLNAVESLSNVNILCLDKTGTLTSGQLVLEQIVTDFGELDSHKASQQLQQFVSSITSFNSTTKAVLTKLTPSSKLNLKEEVAFSSKYKWSGILDDNNQALILGAPEILMTQIQDQKMIQAIQAQLDHYQSLGQRVLIFGRSSSSANILNSDNQPILPENLELVALIVLSDKLRDEAQTTIAKFQNVGVQIKIISGDSPKTVAALAKQIGFGNTKFISGLELAELNDLDFAQQVNQCSIFGRITPEQKERIVITLKESGNYVAMVGDGVNDVMSLKAANLGIAMESGSPATRSVAEIILLGDSFASLPVGLNEGQKIRSGLENVLKLYLSRVAFIVIIVIATYLAALPFPLGVKQKQLLSLIGNGLPSILLTLLARPKVNFSKSVLASVASLVIPAGISIAGFATLLLFWLKWIDRMRSDIVITAAQNQVTLLSFLIIASLILNVIISWPKSDEDGKIPSADWRTLISVGTSFGLIAVLAICVTVPAIAKFLNLVPLTGFQIGSVIVILPIWTIAFLTLLRYRVINRFFKL